MKIAFLLFIAMVYCHILDDYVLQGWLASAKQKSWWEKNAPDKLYRHDYLMALSMHAMSWATSISIPLLVYAWVTHSAGVLTWVLVLWPINAIFHALVDHSKANAKKINLIQDQLLHLVQIVGTIAWAVYA